MNSLAVSRLRVVKFALLGGWEGGREGLRSPSHYFRHKSQIHPKENKYTRYRYREEDVDFMMISIKVKMTIPPFCFDLASCCVSLMVKDAGRDIGDKSSSHSANYQSLTSNQ